MGMLGELNRLGNVNRAQLGTKLNALITSVNEQRTDHATNVTLLTELVADHATFKAVVDELVTDHATFKAVVDELVTDHATFKTVVDELVADHATFKAVVDELVGMINELVSDRVYQNRVVRRTAGGGVGLGVDAGDAADIETTQAVVMRLKGQDYAVAAVAALDISVAGTCAGDTIALSKAGAGWVFLNPSAGLDIETDKAAADYDTAIQALAQYAVATNTLPPGTDDVPVGCVQVTEGGSGLWTWGTDSITGETETYYSFEGHPGVENAIATFALDAGLATFSYGAGTIRLGTGTRVSLTGKANVTLAGSNVIDGQAGAWLFYALANDNEYALQLGAAYASLAVAQAAVRDHNPNPLLTLIGVIYVENASGADFIPGTTALDAAGITATFVTVGPGANHLEIGRAQLGQPHAVMGTAAPATLAAAAPATLAAAAPATLAAAAPDTLTAAPPATLAAAAVDVLIE